MTDTTSDFDTTTAVVDGVTYNTNDKIKFTTTVYNVGAGSIALIAECDTDHEMPVGIIDPQDPDEILWLEPGQFEKAGDSDELNIIMVDDESDGYVCTFDFDAFPIGAMVELTEGVPAYNFEMDKNVILMAGTKVEIVSHDPQHETEHVEVRVDREHAVFWLEDGQFKPVAESFELVAFDPNANVGSGGFLTNLAPLDPLFTGPENIQTLTQNGERLNVHVINGSTDNGVVKASVSTVYKQDLLPNGRHAAFRYQVADIDSVTGFDGNPSEIVNGAKFVAFLTAPNGDIVVEEKFGTKLAAVKWIVGHKLPDEHIIALAMMALIFGNPIIGG